MTRIQVHLEMIQNVVNRLSRNSFLLKGWSVILVSAFFALAAVNSKVYFGYCQEDCVKLPSIKLRREGRL